MAAKRRVAEDTEDDMNIKSFSYLMFAGAIALTGCPNDDTGGTGNGTDDPTTGSPTTTPSTSAPSTSSPSTTATDTGPDTDTTPMTDTGATDTGATTTGDPTAFEFRDDPPDAYTQIDRMGLPAINTALNIAGDKDAYNASNPADDIAGMWDDEAFDSLSILHEGDVQGGNPDPAFGLDDDLIGAGFNVCPVVGAGDCDEQTGGVMPNGDQISLDTEVASGFPNGRQPQDAVMDILLAVALLDLIPPNEESITALAELPVNPTMNDVAFPGDFPWFAPAQ
jgi:hypothetical protein